MAGRHAREDGSGQQDSATRPDPRLPAEGSSWTVVRSKEGLQGQVSNSPRLALTRHTAPPCRSQDQEDGALSSKDSEADDAIEALFLAPAFHSWPSASNRPFAPRVLAAVRHVLQPDALCALCPEQKQTHHCAHTATPHEPAQTQASPHPLWPPCRMKHGLMFGSEWSKSRPWARVCAQHIGILCYGLNVPASDLV